MPKKILILLNKFHTLGGLEKNAWRISLALRDKGYEVFILCASNHLSIEENNIIFLESKTIKWPPSARLHHFDKKAIKFQKSNDFSLVLGLDKTSMQTHFRAGNGCHKEYLKKRMKIENFFKKILISINPYHKTILRIQKKAFENPALKKIIVNSNMVKKEILKYFKTPEDKISVIHNGVEWNEKQNDFELWKAEKDNFIKINNIQNNLFHFLFIGSGYKRKGLIQLINALEVIKNENFLLSIVGKDKNQKFFKKHVKKKGLEKKVMFHSFTDNPISFYQLADCVVIPSIYDPFANVTLEALSMGNFVITSSSNGAWEILNHKNGMVIEDIFNKTKFSQALLFAMNKKKKTKKSSEAIRNSVKDYDFSKHLNEVIKVLIDE